MPASEINCVRQLLHWSFWLWESGRDESSRQLLVSEKMYFDRAAGTVVGGVEGFHCFFEGIPMSNEALGDMRVPRQNIDRLLKIMMFVVMAIEHGRDNGDFLQHQGVRKRHGGPDHAELHDGAAGSGGPDAGIEGLLSADGVEREVVVGAWCGDGSGPQSVGGS